MSSVYHFHIPKTAGRYIQNSLMFSLNVACKRNNINTRNTLITSHSGWDLVEENQYLFTIVRDPVERTLSHIMFYNPFFRQENIEDTKRIVLEYLNSEDAGFLHNYQSKFLSSVDLDMENKFHTFFDYDLSILTERLSRFNKIIKCEELSDEILAELYNQSCIHLGMENEVVETVPYNVPDTIYFNNISGEIFDILTESEYTMIQELNSDDVSLYNSISV